MLIVKKSLKKCVFFRKKKLHLYSSQAKILAKKQKEERPKVVITMASYALQTPPRLAHASRMGQFGLLQPLFGHSHRDQPQSLGYYKQKSMCVCFVVFTCAMCSVTFHIQSSLSWNLKQYLYGILIPRVFCLPLYQGAVILYFFHGFLRKSQIFRWLPKLKQ